MKYIKLFVLVTMLTLSYSQTKAQQYVGTMIDFRLYSSNLTVATNSESTTFKFNVGGARVLDKVVNGVSFWRPFKMNFKLGIESGEIFSTVYTISDSDFSSGIGNVFKDFTATIANSKLPNAKYLIIYYNDPSFGFTTYNQYYSTKHYISNNTTTTPPVVVPPVVVPITNNMISIQEDPSGPNYPTVIGSIPQGGPSIFYEYEWQTKDGNGNFVTEPSYIRGKDSSPFYGKTFRRVVKSMGTVGYSNELTITKPRENKFSVIKTAVYDVNGSLTGNKIKILLQNQDQNIRFSVLGFGPDDPFPIKVDSNYEFILPLYYNNVISSDYEDSKNYFVNIVANSGNSARIYPTWRSGVDTFK